MNDIKAYLTENDYLSFKQKEIAFSTIENQYKIFCNGIKNLKIFDVADIKNSGIKQISNDNLTYYSRYYENKSKSLKIVKFVPASGAASRMFKSLFEYQKNKNTENLASLFSNIKNFAFYNDLNSILKKNSSNLETEIKNENYEKIINLILTNKGLNYGYLPKGLIKFHNYPNGETRTAFEEHISESVEYATGKTGNFIHFTVSPEHKQKFNALISKIIPKYEKKHNTTINVEFSEQLHSTDTMAVTPDNLPFRLEDNSILFRPGGHGALIHNLNNIKADIIFVKNIDNILPDTKRQIDTKYKKALAGILIETQNKIFEFIDMLLHTPSTETINNAFDYLHNTLNIKISFNFAELPETEKIKFLLEKLDRPIRVCGMVKNQGEPGGGPFFVMNNDNTANLQILEKDQIDLTKTKNQKIFNKSTHFNPVDIVLSSKKYNGDKFDLNKYIDKNTAFIATKNKNGKKLKALELPGLWNGAMANWNTIFIEVPLDTFNPVKTIFDLLRENHQNL